MCFLDYRPYKVMTNGTAGGSYITKRCKNVYLYQELWTNEVTIKKNVLI